MTTRHTITADQATPGNTTRPVSEPWGMTTPPPAAPTEPAPRRTRPRWLRLAIAAPIVAAAVAAAVILINHAANPPIPTFTIHGFISAPGIGDGNGGCHTTEGYSDITAGTAVIVASPTGQTVATGALGAGEISEGVCAFPITVPAVPGNLASYSITISHRGTQVLTPASAHQAVELSLG